MKTTAPVESNTKPKGNELLRRRLLEKDSEKGTDRDTGLDHDIEGYVAWAEEGPQQTEPRPGARLLKLVEEALEPAAHRGATKASA